MHIYFPVSRRRAGSGDEPTAEQLAADAGQLLVLRDPDDESEWQYLGNPEVAMRTSLTDVVARFIQECSGADGAIESHQVVAALRLRDALCSAAQQIDDALKVGNGSDPLR
jgi:hypothetical protein